MKKIGVTGRRSTITAQLQKLYDGDEFIYGTAESLPIDLDYYIFVAGVLHGKNLIEITEEEAIESFKVNFFDVVRSCEKILASNNNAKICVLGSYSAIKGSYDMTYAGAKSALHLYVESKKMSCPTQHLVCVAPTIIYDSGMTQRREDLDMIDSRATETHLGRWLTSEEIARSIKYLLEEPSLCNTVLPIHGGR